MVITIVMETEAPARRLSMWVVELNIAGFRIRRWTRKRRHLLRPAPSALKLWARPTSAA